jgi:iron complex outermembrane receptor protein
MNKKGTFKIQHSCLCGLTALLTGITLATAHAQQIAARDFLHLSIEELSQIKISSVSKQEESLSDAPASIYVITNADIRISGATSIPEALRLAPNLHVARAGSGQYAISARGFNNAIGNKLLVLIDGRTIYSPVFSGVFWDQQDVMLEDIERIEVISGPGGTLWGSNAVNGVINIITRSTAQTRGGLLQLGGGTHERGAGGRYGGAIGEAGNYRVYVKGVEVDHSQRTDGSGIEDTFEREQAGFRLDWDSEKYQITLQGDFYDGNLGNLETSSTDDETRFHGGNILGRYTRRFGNDSELAVQSYLDRAVRDNDYLLQIEREKMEIFDTEVQYALPPLSSNRIMLGAGYRRAEDRVTNDLSIEPFGGAPFEVQFFYTPENKDLKWRNFFIQDEIALSDSVDLTLGVKWEENIYTGTERLPSARLAWQPQPGKLLWSSASRAIRAPARIDRDFHTRIVFPLPSPFPPIIADLINGGPGFESEVSDVAEIGWRAQPTDAFSYSVTAFYHEHDKQRSGERAPEDMTGFAFLVSNTIEGSSKGVEAWGNYQVSDQLMLSGGLSQLRHDLRNKPGSTDPAGPRTLGNDPKYTSMLRSTLNINDRHQLYVMARHVSELPNPVVPAFTAVDLRYGWQLGGGFELSMLLQNLFDTGHVEFYGENTDLEEGDPPPPLPIEYERGAFFKLTWTN